MSPIDNDAVEIILDQHSKELEKQDLRLSKLEETTNKLLITNAENSIKLSNIENGQLKLEKNLLEYSNDQKQFQNILINENKKFQENLVGELLKKDLKNDEHKNNLLNRTHDELWGIFGKFFGVLILGGTILEIYLKISGK